MATVQKNVSKRTGEVLNWKWTALLGRENGKQIKITKRVQPLGMTPAAEKKQMQRDADEWEKQEREEYKKLKGRENEDIAKAKKEKDKITLVDFIDTRWIPKHVKNGANQHTPDTIAFYINMSNGIKEYFNRVSPGIKLAQVELEDVTDYLSYMRNEAKTKAGKPYGATTIQHRYSTLRNIFEFAVYMKYVKTNPCKEVRAIDRPKREEKDVDFLDTDEAIRFLRCLDSEEEKKFWNDTHRDPLMWKCLVNVLITTALRRGELVGLQWGDIDKENKLLLVQRNVSIDTSNKEESDPEKKVHVGQLKGRGKNEYRRVPISTYVINLLEEYKRNQEDKFGAAFLPHAYIFCRDNDPYLPLYPTEPTRMMAKYIKRHKLPNMSPHDLRHTAGFLAIEGGANVKQVQALLGHKDPAVTMKFYIGITEKAQHNTNDGIENVIRPKRA